MAEKTIKHVAFTYATKVNDQRTGVEKTVFRTALRGQTVDVTDPIDLEKGEKYGAFYSQEELDAQAGHTPAALLERELAGEDEEEFDMDGATLEQVEEWIIEAEPTVAEVIAMADGDPDYAELLLRAENSATGNDPRKGVVDGLQKIIDAGE